MACGQNPFHHSKSSLDAELLNTSLQSEESFGHHDDHTEDGYLSRDVALEENLTSGLSCLNSVESVLQETSNDSLRHDGRNPPFSLKDQPDEQTLSKHVSSVMDQNSYEAALDPALLTMTSLDCYSDISSCSEKDLSWLSDICAEKNPLDQSSEYQMIESTEDILMEQLEKNSCSFIAEKAVALEGSHEVTEKQNMVNTASVEEENGSQSDCCDNVLEDVGQGERAEAPTVCKDSHGLDFFSTQQKTGNENNVISEDVHADDGDHFKEQTKMLDSKHDAPEDLLDNELVKIADGTPQCDKSEKKLANCNKEHSNSAEFLQSCFDTSSLDHTNELEPDFLVRGTMNQIHHNCDVNHTQSTFGPTDSQIQDAAVEILQEPPVFNTCNKARVSPEPGPKNASAEDKIILNLARTECGNETETTSNVLLLSSSKFMKKLQPVVLLRTAERIVNDGNVYQCSVCQQTTHSLNEVLEHHHYKHCYHKFNYCHAYGCYLCNETMAVQHLCGPKYLQQPGTPKNLIKKLDATFICQYCNKPFVRKAPFHDHMQRHVVVTQYRCKRCGLFFPEETLLKSHRRKTNCTRLILDPIAQLKGSSKIDLMALRKPTLKLENDSPQGGRDCFVKLIDITKDQSPEETGSVSGKSSELQGHLKTYADSKPFRCNKCKKCFKYSWNLTRHNNEQCFPDIKQIKKPSTAEALHAKYVCPICSNVYSYPQNVSRHLWNMCLKQYTGKGKGKVGTRYKCPLCDETFSMSSNRRRHIKNTCFHLYKSKIFNLGRSVEVEIKKEKEGKILPVVGPQISQNYKCKVCPAWFAKHSQLSEHMKKHEERTTASKDTADTNETNSSQSPSEERTVSSALTCRFCERHFSLDYSLKNHLQLHKGSKPYLCVLCGKSFKMRRQMIRHKNVHKRKVQCSVCKEILPTVTDLLKHRQSHVKKGMLQCPDCPMQFRFPVFFLRHVATHEKKNKMKTAVTTYDDQFEAQKVEDIDEKQANKSKPKPTVITPCQPSAAQQVTEDRFCALCQKTFDDSKALSVHCQTHLPPVSVSKCPFCVPDRRFTSRTALIRHIRLHTGEKPFSCQKCGMRFRRKEALGPHQVKCNGIVETPAPPPPSKTLQVIETHDEQKVSGSESKVQKRLICSYCPYVFSTAFNLSLHEGAHKANNLVPCSKCGRCYKRNKIYRHKRECRSIQSYSEDASSDQKINTRQGTLRDDVHPVVKNVQSGEGKTLKTDRRRKEKRKNQCPHCLKLFLYKSYLLRHLQTHLNTKGQVFADQNSHPEHEQSYGEAKPFNDCELFKCKSCTKTFSTLEHLQQHILSHKDASPCKYETCKASFVESDHLTRQQATFKGKSLRLEGGVEEMSHDHAGTEEQMEMQPAGHACSFCSKPFSKEVNLKRHIAMQHPSYRSPILCRKCGDTFISLKCLKTHECMATCKSSSGESVKSKDIPPKSDEVLRSTKELRRLMKNDEEHRTDAWKLKCKYCSRRFKFPSQLKGHVLFHTGEKAFKCTKCEECFPRGDYLKRHYAKCGGKGGFRVPCKGCGRLFSQEALNAHKVNCDANSKIDNYPKTVNSTENSSKPEGFSCARCNARFLLFSQLKEHVSTAHRSGGLRRSNMECQQLTKAVHIKDEAVDEGYSENPLPNEQGNAGEELNKPFKCQQCCLRFLTRSGLVTHMRIHATIWPLSCKKCNKGFWSKFLQQKHMRKCKELGVFKKECDLSEQDPKQNDKVLVFNSRSNTTGTGVLQTKFSCKGQDVGEMGKEDVVVHKYQCSECDQSFTDGLRLISHLEAHRREEQEGRDDRLHSCNFCDETFDQADLLRTHVKTCHQSSENTCFKCSKSFRYPSDLALHQSCHDPKRPFACDKCEMRYWTARALTAHDRIAHSTSEPIKTIKSAPRNSSGSPNAFTCDPCNRVYTNRKSYMRHCRLKHRHSERLGEPKSATVEQQLSETEPTRNDTVDEVSASDEDYDSDSAPYFPCHVCGKTFRTSESLEDHQRCHLGEKPYECEECGKCFFQLVNLQQHQRSHKSEFQCRMCGKGFVSLFALRKHKLAHGRKRPHQCPKCALTFTKSSELAEHMISHRDENFPCDVCHENFSCKASRAEHRKIHTETEEELPPLIPPAKQTSSGSEKDTLSPHQYKYHCEFCQGSFPDLEKLFEHDCTQPNEKQYSCTECNMHFPHGSHLKKHQLTHQLSGTRSFRCNTCHMSFTHRSHFLTHLQTHNRNERSEPQLEDAAASVPDQEKIYKCPICPESFAQALELASHLSVHSHMCSVCRKTFGTKQQLEIHEQSHLSPATQYECTECGKSFLGSDAFRQHYCANKHSDKRPSRSSRSPSSEVIKNDEDEEEVDVGQDFYNCPTCDKRFSSSASLLEHQKLHEVERPFKCLVCAKGFTLKKYLIRHQAKHDERPYQCDKCSDAFKTESAFISHCKTHDAHRYHCSMCNKSYISRYDLGKHEKKHRESQSFGDGRGEHRCDMCFKSFSLLSQLRQHQESHVGQVVYECTECDKAFAYFNLLEEHQQTHAMSVDYFPSQTVSNEVCEDPDFE